MALIVQDDAGSVSGANAYVALADFVAFYVDRGESLATDYTDPQMEAAIVKATDFLDSRYRYAGTRLTITQGTQFPRVLEDRTWPGTSRSVNGAPWPGVFTGIPHEVKKACYMMARRALDKELMPDPTVDPTMRQVEEVSTTVGPVAKTVRYSSGGSQGSQALAPAYPEVDLLLRAAQLLAAPGGVVVRS